MLTGKLPFSGATVTALSLQIVQAPAPAPSSINKGLPKEFDPIVSKALAKSVNQRYESAGGRAAELRALGAVLDVRSGTSEPADLTLGLPRASPPSARRPRAGQLRQPRRRTHGRSHQPPRSDAGAESAGAFGDARLSRPVAARCRAGAQRGSGAHRLDAADGRHDQDLARTD